MSITLFKLLSIASLETLYMTLISSFLASMLGIPLGIVLYITRMQGIKAHPLFNRFIAAIVNAIRSIPFIILMVAIIPFTRLLIGTSIGTTAAIVPLTLAAIPFVARVTQSALLDISPGLIETGFALGATTIQIIQHILLTEARAGIIHGITLTMITLVGYSAMAGAIGGGGLGDIAISYGYQRFNPGIMIITIIILIVMVQAIQMLGDYCAQKQCCNNKEFNNATK